MNCLLDYLSSTPEKSWSIESLIKVIINKDPSAPLDVITYKILKALQTHTTAPNSSKSSRKRANELLSDSSKPIKATIKKVYNNTKRIKPSSGLNTNNITYNGSVENASQYFSESIINIHSMQQQQQQAEEVPQPSSSLSSPLQQRHHDLEEVENRFIKKQRLMENQDDDNGSQYTEEEVWEEWVNYLNMAKDNPSIHQYSPIKHGIIIAGKGISPNIGVNNDSYYWYIKNMDDDNTALELNDVKNYVDPIIDSKTIEDMDNYIYSTIPIKGHESTFKFIQAIFITMEHVYNTSPPLSHSESVLNVNLIFPCINAVIDFIMKCNKNNDFKVYFVPGEEQLVSLTKQLQRLGKKHDERYRYNADGIIKVGHIYDLEILILETSGSTDNHDNTKISFDFHKGMFGLLSMAKTIADRFEFATLETFKKLKMYFIQVSGGKCRVWSLYYKKDGVFMFCREDKVEINQNFNEKEDYLMPLINFFGNIKGKLIRCINVLGDLQKEHNDNKRQYRYHQPNNAPPLLSKIINPTILRLCQHSDSKGLGDELPGSSPGICYD